MHMRQVGCSNRSVRRDGDRAGTGSTVVTLVSGKLIFKHCVHLGKCVFVVIRVPFAVAVRKPRAGIPGTRGSVPSKPDTFHFLTLSTPTEGPSIVHRQLVYRG